MDDRIKNILWFMAIIAAAFPIAYLIVMFTCS